MCFIKNSIKPYSNYHYYLALMCSEQLFRNLNNWTKTSGLFPVKCRGVYERGAHVGHVHVGVLWKTAWVRQCRIYTAEKCTPMFVYEPNDDWYRNWQMLQYIITEPCMYSQTWVFVTVITDNKPLLKEKHGKHPVLGTMSIKPDRYIHIEPIVHLWL